MSGNRKFKRVILKLSGEALAGEKGYGIDPKTVDAMMKLDLPAGVEIEMKL